MHHDLDPLVHDLSLTVVLRLACRGERQVRLQTPLLTRNKTSIVGHDPERCKDADGPRRTEYMFRKDNGEAHRALDQSRLATKVPDTDSYSVDGSCRNDEDARSSGARAMRSSSKWVSPTRTSRCERAAAAGPRGPCILSKSLKGRWRRFWKWFVRGRDQSRQRSGTSERKPASRRCSA